ncbi:DUF4127 family protein [Phascolarctobacterium sp.]
MNRKKFILLILLLLCAYFYKLFGGMPTTVPFTPQAVKTDTSLLLVPLDSRPPCTAMVRKLGALASINVITPPQELLDNYNTPADKEKLFQWLQEELPQQQAAILSADLLVHGSLLASRVPLGTPDDEANFLAFVNKQRKHNPQIDMAVFSVIPRLLVSDQLIPDSWYQWHLMRYATLKDMAETFGDPYFTEQLLEIDARIPDDIKTKYSNLYTDNDSFNKKLVQLAADDELTLVIGQDDAQPFGLPNRNANHVLAYMEHAGLGSRGLITSGADEIASLLLTRYYNKLHNFQPRIFVEYSSPKVAAKIMPYMPCSVDASIRDKVSFINGRLTDDAAEADFILFVHCGDDDNPPTKAMLKKLSTLLASGRHVALVDLTANYTANELLVPQLLDAKVPLNRLTAFSGWNTLSNSLGTALSQATLFVGQLHRLPQSEYPALYTQNLSFTVERLLDDYAYQKLMHAQLTTLLKLKGYTPTDLGANKFYAETFIRGFLQRQKFQLLYGNLGRTPFYSSDKKNYYLTGIDIDVSLPWTRIFEISLDTKCRFGESPRQQKHH